jgi:hypothetical protein
MRQLLYEVEFQAKIRANGPYSSGNLSESIVTEGPINIPDGVTGRVGSRLPYASSVESGAKVHPIFPKAMKGVYRFGSPRRPQLKFFWRRVGRTVMVPHIPISPRTIGRSHPGQKGKGYLRESLHDVARRHRMRVVTSEL